MPGSKEVLIFKKSAFRWEGVSIRVDKASMALAEGRRGAPRLPVTAIGRLCLGWFPDLISRFQLVDSSGGLRGYRCPLRASFYPSPEPD